MGFMCSSENWEKMIDLTSKLGERDPFHTVISLSNRSLIEKSIKLFLKMKGQIAY